MRINRPVNDYDAQAWLAFYAAHPGMKRSIGAEGEDNGSADGAEAGDETGNGDGAGGGDGTGDAGAAASAGDKSATELGAGKGDAGDKGGNKAEPTWRDTIEDESLREHASRFTSVEALAKAHRDLRAKMSTAVNEPGEDATDDEIAEYRAKRGVPETPDAYSVPEIENFEPSDADKAYQAEMAGVFHKHNIPDAVFKDLAAKHVGYLVDQQKAAVEAQNKADKEYLSNAEEALRKEWGGDYKANVQYADEAAKAFWDEDIGSLELKNGMLLGSHPAFMKGSAEIGRRIGEGIIHVPHGSEAASSLQEQADTYRQKRVEAQQKGDTKGAQKWDKMERDTLKKIHG